MAFLWMYCSSQSQTLLLLHSIVVWSSLGSVVFQYAHHTSAWTVVLCSFFALWISYCNSMGARLIGSRYMPWITSLLTPVCHLQILCWCPDHAQFPLNTVACLLRYTPRCSWTLNCFDSCHWFLLHHLCRYQPSQQNRLNRGSYFFRMPRKMEGSCPSSEIASPLQWVLACWATIGATYLQ